MDDFGGFTLRSGNLTGSHHPGGVGEAFAGGRDVQPSAARMRQGGQSRSGAKRRRPKARKEAAAKRERLKKAARQAVQFGEQIVCCICQEELKREDACGCLVPCGHSALHWLCAVNLLAAAEAESLPENGGRPLRCPHCRSPTREIVKVVGGALVQSVAVDVQRRGGVRKAVEARAAAAASSALLRDARDVSAELAAERAQLAEDNACDEARRLMRTKKFMRAVVAALAEEGTYISESIGDWVRDTRLADRLHLFSADEQRRVQQLRAWLWVSPLSNGQRTRGSGIVSQEVGDERKVRFGGLMAVLKAEPGVAVS